MCQKFSDWHIVSPCGETLSYEIFFKFSNKHNSIKMIFSFESLTSEAVIHQEQQQIAGSNDQVPIEISGA